MLRGEAGSGKSALLKYLSAEAIGWRVASAIGVESEMELAYSGLHQLCAPMLSHLERMPHRQRDALATAFGLSAAPAPDRFMVGLATLTLLSDAAERQPLLCIVDDAQWLDSVSAQILAFVAGRLLAEQIALVCAARTGVGDEVLARQPTLPVGGLTDEDARALLLANIHGLRDPDVVDQLVADSHGNPLGLLELPRTWTPRDVAGGFGLPDSQAVASRIEQSYVRRLAELPADTQLLILTAAAEPSGDLGLLWRAVRILGIDPLAVRPAEVADLVRISTRVEFKHPLIRSATYRAALREERQRVHGALAEATDAETDPDRRAWHRGRASKTPNESVAAELRRSAGRAQARGGYAAAAAFLVRATELTPDPRRRSQRALEAAFAGMQAGLFENAQTMLTFAAEGPLDDMSHARIDLLRAQLAFASSRGTEAIPLLMGAARRLETLDVQLASETYLDAFSAAMFAARLSGEVGVREVAAAVRAAPRRASTEAGVADLLLDALVKLAGEYGAAVPPSKAVVAKLSSDAQLPADRLRWLWQGCVIALEIWDDEGAYVLSEHHLDLARRAGALGEVALALSARIPVLLFSGEISAAVASVAEAQSVEEATGVSAAPYGALIVAAWRGSSLEVRRLIENTLRDAGARGEGVGVAICEYARAVLCNSTGQYEQACEAASSASGYREIVAENWGLTELIEAASRTGQLDLARDALSRLTEKAQASRTDWALGVHARSAALLSDGDTAEGFFREASDRLGRTRMRTEQARTHLLYGESLRRANRRVDARRELGVALELFVAMGMEGFAERARRELQATGAIVQSRNVDTRDDLTAQEIRVARLARDGLSNLDIGAQMFISARTVEWHLRKVFTKLGITSRRHLREALSGREHA